MDNEGIALIILGALAIAVGIFGKFRPDIVYRDWSEKRTIGGFRLFGFSAFRVGGKNLSPEYRQRFGFVTFILFGIMLVLAGVALGVPQWQAYKSAITISIVMVMTVVLLLMYWRILLSQNERFRGLGLAVVLLLSAAMLVVAAYYWRITLN